MSRRVHRSVPVTGGNGSFRGQMPGGSSGPATSLGDNLCRGFRFRPEWDKCPMVGAFTGHRHPPPVLGGGPSEGRRLTTATEAPRSDCRLLKSQSPGARERAARCCGFHVLTKALIRSPWVDRDTRLQSRRESQSRDGTGWSEEVGDARFSEQERWAIGGLFQHASACRLSISVRRHPKNNVGRNDGGGRL